MGISIVAVSYDELKILNRFKRKHKLPFVLLSDRDSAVIKQLELLNETIEVGSRYYGVPWPGIYLLDDDGTVRYKFAEENYRDRPPFPDIIEAAGTLQRGTTD